jgi:photosystem I P700 chlorophyll a apoprotein A1
MDLNLHADAHDFDMQTKSLEDISRKIFSAHWTTCNHFPLD